MALIRSRFMLINFLKRYSFKQILKLILEDHVRFIVSSIPGYEGVLVRRFALRFIFKKIGKGSIVYVNVYITHAHNIIAGDYLTVNSGTHIDGRGNIEIGDYVLIGPNVFIGSSNHHISVKGNGPRTFLDHLYKPVKIGSNVWIGANSVICPGVKIGDNSIIGAGSVVKHDVPESVIVAGNPAVFIKKLC